MKTLHHLTAVLILLCACLGCANTTSHSMAVYMLVDTSGTYAQQLGQAQKVINSLLTHLDSGDTLVVARIDSGSFSEKDIVAKVTFDGRPSVANQQKIQYKSAIDDFIAKVKSSTHTDIKGGLLQAVDCLNEIKAAKKTILIFSDLEEDLPEGYKRKLNNNKRNIEGFRVVALNVTKLGADQIDPERYFERLSTWETTIVELGGKWDRINDLDHMDTLWARQ